MRALLYSILILGLVICLAPAISVGWAGWFADAHGCTLHEGFANPCIVDGRDWGQTLYTAFVMGWLMLVTLPVAAVLGIALLILVVWDVLRRLRR